MSGCRVAILISGSGSNMEALAQSMTGDHPARPAIVISNRPGVAGLARAARLGVPTAVVDHTRWGRDRAGFEAALDAELVRAGAELVCLAGFMRILTADFVAARAGSMLNIHPSLLPFYRGLSTHARVLAAGDIEHGCSVHLVTPDLDAGPVLGQARLRVREDDTAETLAARVQALEHRLYPLVLRRFVEGVLDPVMLEAA